MSTSRISIPMPSSTMRLEKIPLVNTLSLVERHIMTLAIWQITVAEKKAAIDSP